MIKKASNSDIRVIAELALKLWPDNCFDDIEREIKSNISSNEATVFITIENEEPVGFALCLLRHDYVEGTSSSPVGYLEGVYIRDIYRNSGRAKELIRFCESWAKQNGCTEFASDCELTNTDSLLFHQKVGFTEVNRQICFAKKI